MQEEDLMTVAMQEELAQVVVRWTKAGSNHTEEKIVELPISFGRTPDNTIVLPSENKLVSRLHAIIEWDNGQLKLIDKDSTNGTMLNGERHEQVIVEAGDEIKLGEYTLMVELFDGDKTRVMNEEDDVKERLNGGPNSKLNDEEMLLFCQQTDRLQPFSRLTTCVHSILPSMFDQPVVSLQELEQANMPLRETTYLTIGGGMGSFVWADYLVICGAKPSQVTAIGFSPIEPYGRYQQLCRHSQIPIYERLRSNSDSCPDNVWGWPGYAVREIWGCTKQGNFGQAAKISWQIFNEPLAETYTPRSQDVFDAIDGEAKRIGWDNIWREGRVEAIRKTNDSRYVVLYSQPQQNGETKAMLMVTKHLHIAVGYPGVRFLPDLVEYSLRTGNDERRVVNAYEEHEHVYDYLSKFGGTVLVRGRGIVGSRIIQRLNEVRLKLLRDKKESKVQILHLMRSPKAIGHRFGRSRRVVENHWEFQPFNWPKATWSGTEREQLERGNPTERDELLTVWGGTTTANRRDWRDIIGTGLKEGWYEIEFGAVERVEQDSENGKVVTIIRHNNIASEQKLSADFIIDATGLDANLNNNPLLADLIEHHDLKLNPKGRLQVTNEFEIEGMRNGTARMYASGVMTLGGPYAPVDTFLGLQYTALRSVDNLINLKAPSLKKLNGFRSVAQWIRWTIGVTP